MACARTIGFALVSDRYVGLVQHRHVVRTVADGERRSVVAPQRLRSSCAEHSALWLRHRTISPDHAARQLAVGDFELVCER